MAIDDLIETEADELDLGADDFAWLEDGPPPIAGLRHACDVMLEQIGGLSENTALAFYSLRELPGVTNRDVRRIRDTINSEVPFNDPLYVPTNAVAENLHAVDVAEQLHAIAGLSSDPDTVEECLDVLTVIAASMARAVRGRMPKRGRSKRSVIAWKKSKEGKAATAWKKPLSIKEKIKAAAAKAPTRRLRMRRLWDF